MTNVLLDNDVIYKVCRWNLASAAVDAASQLGAPAILGSAKFVLAGRLRRNSNAERSSSTSAQLTLLLTAVEEVEPDAAAITLAAEFQEVAQELDLPLDIGESQLLAIVLTSGETLLLTGDKRAIKAAERATAHLGIRDRAAGCLACLEQLITTLAARVGANNVRSKICRDPDADVAVSICFSCESGGFEPANALEGLVSYIQDLRSRAPTLLIAGEGLVPCPT